MADQVLPAAEPESPMSDFGGMFNFFIDAQAAAKRLPRKWFWIAPLILASIVLIVLGVLNMPLVQQAMMNQPPPPNMDPERYQHGMQVGMMIQKVAVFLSPVIMVVFWAIMALIVYGACAVISIQARFIELFNLMAGLSLITMLQAVVQAVILHAKGEPSGMADLQPAIGLDIFAPQGTNHVLVAFLGFVNVFEIWMIVMAVLITAAAYRVTKGKAVVAILPLFALALLLKLVGAFFSPR
ncbi:MAG TPA: YIP1 family protein [Bryobacteraceae bacterium]|nr:YIP1 family protein [Bryobacteraceae bacterium]